MSTIDLISNVLKPNLQVNHGFVVSRPGSEVADFHHKLPGYHHTAVHDLPAIAEKVGVAQVIVKDESTRLELPSFKMLGASWASFNALADHTGIDREGWNTLEELAERLRPFGPLTLAAATDGNHGRAVARMASLLGLNAVIYVPDDMAAARIKAIESEGADVIVVDGYYDDAIAMSAAAASVDTLVVSDTSWEGYEDIPRRVIEGYSTIFDEVDTQLDTAASHVFIPLGVGALGAATVAHFHDAVPRPQIIGVEPLEAACVQEALEVGEVVTIESQFRTSMVGLNCGTASRIAYPALAAGLDWTVAISDQWSDEAMRLYADNSLVSGESGAACLGGLLAINDSKAHEEVGLDSSSIVLLIITESATDPENYLRVVGDLPATSDSTLPLGALG